MIVSLLSGIGGGLVLKIIDSKIINRYGITSYSQYGEDLICSNIFQFLKIQNPTYIDIGANHPIMGNNTYYFYKNGSRGILIEPNPAMYKLLTTKRNGDKVLNCGIGVTTTREADFYMIDNGEIGWDTFSKDDAENAEKVSNGKHKITKIIKIPLVNINEVFQKYLNGKAPDLCSIDVEGFEMPILKSINFHRFRPVVFCIETVMYDSFDSSDSIIRFMRSKNYTMRGRNIVNLVFVDDFIFNKIGLIKK